MARDEARRNQSPPEEPLPPPTRGSVFAKSDSLPDGLINHSHPNGFIPVERLDQYGTFAVLGSDSATTDDSPPLAWVGGSGNAMALTRCLGGMLATAPVEQEVLAVVLVPEASASDRALYTLDQYAALTSARTRARLHVERLPDQSVRAYGFYTGKNREWENVPVVTAIADGEQFVAELGLGFQLIFTPGATTPMPVLRDTAPLPPVWVYPPTDTADKILVNPVHPPAYQDWVVWFPNTEIPPFYISLCLAKTCPHPDTMEDVAAYIAEEMNRNIHDPAVLEMRSLIDYDPVAEARKFAQLPLPARLAGPPNFSGIAKAKKIAAAVIWTKKVGQNRMWDHKPKIHALTEKYWHKQGEYEYYYDIWSNIHYGYVGMAGGLSESALLDGAGAEQIISDAKRKIEEVVKKPEAQWELPGPNRSADIEGLRAWDDAPDRISIEIGIKLYRQHPDGGMTARKIMDEVLAVATEEWGKGVRIHACKKT
ncbi:polymorphic toxin type 44 domain-containing protein [Pseudomonas sp. NPDC089569]|uniref:polymorphic toxin type 44 domain-containing protein n=1 Tax=Pseudomonas sp. NPDC089569 TaxID=3390722 RepID=UPI003D0080EB